MMQLGLGQLQIPPKQFWAMTPKELECAITGLLGHAGDNPMSRSDLENLVNRFPDKDKHG
jgi:uncharacterized phage protein (TIGR02216 family)